MQRKLLLIILPDVSLSSSLVQRAHFLTIYVNIYNYFITNLKIKEANRHSLFGHFSYCSCCLIFHLLHFKYAARH